MSSHQVSDAVREHYRDFYVGPDRGETPLLVVMGNCQAESLRLLLAHDDLRTARVPPLHEIRPDEIDLVRGLLAQADLFVTQPVADDFRGLPLGTNQLLACLPAHARHALVPSVRFAGLHPFHYLVHPPGLDDPDPPVAPYHDVRTTTAAAWARAGRTAPTPPELDVEAVRVIAAESVAELERREARHGTVVVSDLLRAPTADSMRTINHPGNAVLIPLAARVRAALDLPVRAPQVDRPLLNGIHAPLEPAVVACHGLDVAPRPDWVIGERRVAVDEVAEAHLRWYAERPELLDLCLRRSAALRDTLGLQLPAG